MRLNRRVTMALTVFSSTLLLVGCFSSSSSSSSNSYKATITYTEHNVPHIQADNYKGLGFGIGYAQAKENMCTLSEQIMKLRGEKALRSEEHTSELQSRPHLVCRLLLEKK